MKLHRANALSEGQNKSRMWLGRWKVHRKTRLKSCDDWATQTHKHTHTPTHTVENLEDEEFPRNDFYLTSNHNTKNKAKNSLE